MRIFLVTLFPKSLESYLATSILRKAQDQGVVHIEVCNLADFSTRNTRRSDDRPYGWLPGTILAPEPCARAIDHCQTLSTEPIRWICPDPRGETLVQSTLHELSHTKTLGILCGHYEGIDERVIQEYSIERISLGDYILTGWEIAAGVILDGTIRLLPGVLSPESLEEESFSEKMQWKKEYPQYTRPELWRNRPVPKELLSGNPKTIHAWKLNNSL